MNYNINSMFNPFKKKEDEFKLDDISLPSLGDMNPSPENSLNSSTSSFSETSNPIEPSMPEPANSINENPFASPNQATISPSTQNQNPFGNNNNSIQTTTNDNQQNIQNDILKAKVESMESKVTLIDARLSNIEQKLEIIFRMISEEVSNETKTKLNLDTMIQSAKNKLNQ